MAHCEVKKLIADTPSGKWWEKFDKTGGKKGGGRWKTLQHNGVLFPPPYEPLPSSVKVKYNGKRINLDAKNTRNPWGVTAEEAALFFAMKLEQDRRLSKTNKKHKKVMDDKVFLNNFWKEWKVLLGKRTPIKDLKKVDFTELMNFIVERSEKKKSRSKEEKKEEKEEKEKIKEKYGYAIVDGVKMPLGSYMVQPPGLFIGHGHSSRGSIKGRITPSDITLNVTRRYTPKCVINGKPCKWKEIVTEPDKTWIASWKHPITGETTYVFLKRDASHWVCEDDITKFNKARKLDKNIDTVRKKYMKDLNSDKLWTQQLAVAVYLLDVLAIRPGTEKDDTGTAGLTTLQCSHLKFLGDNKISLDFTGKSSIRFKKTFPVLAKVYKLLQDFCKNGGSKKKTSIFPSVNAKTLNDYLKSLLPGITAKVFRTWKASSILQRELDKKIPKQNEPVHSKKLKYDQVNLQVALELNHKKLSQSDTRIEKLKKKIKEFQEKKKNAKTKKQKESAQKSIETNKAKLLEAEHNISTGTSKVNYLDPRITVAWAKKGNVPIEKIYNKTQLGKFVWAMETKASWKF